MPRLGSFTITIETGEHGCTGPLEYIINGFPVRLENESGGTGPGEAYEGTGNPGSFPHTLLLHGPEEGAWDIEALSMTYCPMGEDPYTVRFGAVSLDDQSDLNIWADRPTRVFDV